MTSTEIYTLEEAADLLSCNKEILRQKVSSNKLKAYKKLGRWYLFHSDIIAFIKGDDK